MQFLLKGGSIMRKIILYWLVPFLWIGVIFYFSSQSSNEQDIKPFLSDMTILNKLEPIVSQIKFSYYGEMRSVETMGLERFVEFLIRKLAHFGTYFILAVLIFWAIRKSLQSTINMQIILAFYLVVLFAIVDEFNQAFTPERTPYFGDIMIDSIGGLFGLFVYILILFIRKKLKKKNVNPQPL